MLHIDWVQTKWCNIKGSKRAWAWEGKRKDGRGFRVYYFGGKRGYACVTWNGKHLGDKPSLAQAQALAAAHVGVCLPTQVVAV
jgi:hypothetical protein